MSTPTTTTTTPTSTTTTQQFIAAVRALGSTRHAEAEAFLLQSRTAADAVGTARGILAVGLANPDALAPGLDAKQLSLVLTHAALALREAAVRRYAVSDPPARAETLEWTLETGAHVANHAAVRDALAEAASAQFKRAYPDLDAAAKRRLFAWIANAASQPPKRPFAASLLRALILDFSSSRTSSSGAVIDFHLSAARKFQEFGLKETFQLTMQLVSPSLNHPETLALLAETLDGVLAWPFNAPGSSPRSSDLDADTLASSAVAATYTLLTPGANWTDALVSARPVAVLGNVYMSNLRPAQTTSRHAASACHFLRQAFASLATLSGAVFPDAAAKLAHFRDMQDLAYALLSAAVAPPNDSAAFLTEPHESLAAAEAADACAMASRVASHAPPDLALAQDSLARFGDVGGALSSRRRQLRNLRLLPPLLRNMRRTTTHHHARLSDLSGDLPHHANGANARLHVVAFVLAHANAHAHAHSPPTSHTHVLIPTHIATAPQLRPHDRLGRWRGHDFKHECEPPPPPLPKLPHIHHTRSRTRLGRLLVLGLVAFLRRVARRLRRRHRRGSRFLARARRRSVCVPPPHRRHGRHSRSRLRWLKRTLRRRH